jgi:hypothetical protein
VAVEQRRIETQAELKTANWESVFSIFGFPEWISGLVLIHLRADI